MKLASDSIFEIDKNKIQAYLLNPNHPDGKAKADFFMANGINSDTELQLENLLKQQATQNDITTQLTTPFGIKYIFESPIEFPNGKTHIIRSVWIRSTNEKVIKFVTAYKI